MLGEVVSGGRGGESERGGEGGRGREERDKLELNTTDFCFGSFNNFGEANVSVTTLAVEKKKKG